MTPMMSNMEDLDHGWSWVVLCASFLYFMIFGLFLYGVGIVHFVLLEEYGGKSFTTAWAGSLYAALVSLGGPVSSLIIDRFSCRTAMFLDGVLTTVGCLVTSLSPSVSLCIFTYGVIAGIGGGIGYTATMVVVGLNFRRLRNISLGVAISGVGIGTCILSPVMEVIRDYYGNRGYFIILSGIGFHKCLFAVLCRPSELEIARQKCLSNEKEETLTKRQILKHYAKVYGNKLIICFSFSLMLYSAGTYMIFLHLPAFAISRGFSPIHVTLLLSACGLSTVAARVFTSVASQKKSIDEIVLYSVSFGTLALGTFLFPLYSKMYIGLLIFCLLLGSYFGGCYAIMNSINIKLVGLKYLSIATGMELLFCGVGTALGPIITGFIIDGGGTYEHAFMMAAFFILIGAALGMATVVFQPDGDKPEVPDLDLIVTKDCDAWNETLSAQITNGSDRRKTIATIEEKLTEEDLNLCRQQAAQQTTSQSLFPITSACAEMNPTALLSHSEPIEQPTNFTEEIQKLLNGEDLKFIDDV